MEVFISPASASATGIINQSDESVINMYNNAGGELYPKLVTYVWEVEDRSK